MNPDRHATRRSQSLTARGALGLLTILLAACGGSTQSSGNTSGNSSAKSALASLGSAGPELCQSGRTYNIGYDVFSDREAFAVAFSTGLKAAAAKIGCVKLTVLVDNLDPSTTQQNFTLLAQQKVDGVISFQALVDLYPGLKRKMADAHIPLITIGLSTPGVVFVNHSDKNAGTKAGTLLGKAFAQQHPGEIPYVFRGDFAAGGQTQTDRMDGYVAGIRSGVANIPDDHIISIETKADPVATNGAMKSALTKVPKGAFLLLSSPGDETSNAMLQAAKSDGRSDKTLVAAIGIAGTAGPEFICKNPEYVGGVAFRPETWGNYAFPAIVGLIEKQSVPDFVEVPVQAVARADLKTVIPTASC